MEQFSSYRQHNIICHNDIMKTPKFLKKFVTDRRGKVVIWQVPNLPITAWAIFTIAGRITQGPLHKVFSVCAAASLLIWAVLEIASGASYFRRLLGLAVLAATMYSLFN
jgi:hypothetical protein